MGDLVFVLGDKLPVAHEVVAAILSYAPGGSPYEKSETRKRKEAINSYAKSLICVWSKAFGETHITSRKFVCKKIRNILIDHFLKVRNVKNSKGCFEQFSSQKFKIFSTSALFLLTYIKNQKFRTLIFRTF